MQQSFFSFIAATLFKFVQKRYLRKNCQKLFLYVLKKSFDICDYNYITIQNAVFKMFTLKSLQNKHLLQIKDISILMPISTNVD